MRIFVAPTALVAGELAVRGDEHHYLSRVRRARAGDAVELVDGAGRRADATIVRITADEAVLAVGAPAAIAPALPRLRAVVPLIKGDRMDYLLEKLVEVGVDEVVLWEAQRAVVRFDDARRASRLARYQAEVQAAARQSGRAQLPTVTWGGPLARAIAALPPGLRLVLDPGAADALAARPLAGIADITLLSGPEGGLAPAELDEALGDRAGFAPVSLGPRVLRAETAPVAAIATLRALSGT